MPALPTSVLPKRVPHGPHPPATVVHVSSLLIDAAGVEADAALQKLRTSRGGLSEDEAGRRFREHGPNVVARDERHARIKLPRKALVNPLVNPLVILLVILSASSFATGVQRAGSVILLTAVLGIDVRFVQEARADSAAAKLRAMISVHATVLRGGRAREVPNAELVPGDVVELAAGDMIPADVRLLACEDLFVTPGSLTGESFPVEKFAAREDAAGRAAGAYQRLLPGHQRRERGRNRGRRRHRTHDVPRRHLHRARGGATTGQLRPRHDPVHLADDLFHLRDGPAGIPYQRFH